MYDNIGLIFSSSTVGRQVHLWPLELSVASSLMAAYIFGYTCRNGMNSIGFPHLDHAFVTSNSSGVVILWNLRFVTWATFLFWSTKVLLYCVFSCGGSKLWLWLLSQTCVCVGGRPDCTEGNWREDYGLWSFISEVPCIELGLKIPRNTNYHCILKAKSTPKNCN